MAKRANPDLLSDRAGRDTVLRPGIARGREQNCTAHGVRKVFAIGLTFGDAMAHHQMRGKASMSPDARWHG